jgi:hypothetical protein
MYSSTHSLTSALDEGEWSASRPGRFTPRERLLKDWLILRLQDIFERLGSNQVDTSLNFPSITCNRGLFFLQNELTQREMQMAKIKVQLHELTTESFYACRVAKQRKLFILWH